MWIDILNNLPDFPSAVLSCVDDNGFPFSIRCQLEPDNSDQVLRVRTLAGSGLRLGSASLLFHKHDEWLWNPKSFLVRGILEKDDQGWKLRPQRFVPGVDIGGLWGFVQFLRAGRRKAKQYLKNRDLAWPRIAWDRIQALYETGK